jgi:hypothetical protein
MLSDEQAIRAPIDEKDEVRLAKFVLTRDFRRQLSPGQRAMIVAEKRPVRDRRGQRFPLFQAQTHSTDVPELQADAQILFS